MSPLHLFQILFSHTCLVLSSFSLGTWSPAPNELDQMVLQVWPRPTSSASSPTTPCSSSWGMLSCFGFINILRWAILPCLYCLEHPSPPHTCISHLNSKTIPLLPGWLLLRLQDLSEVSPLQGTFLESLGKSKCFSLGLTDSQDLHLLSLSFLKVGKICI